MTNIASTRIAFEDFTCLGKLLEYFNEIQWQLYNNSVYRTQMETIEIELRLNSVSHANFC